MRQKAFTLLELLVVIGIIAILTSLVAVSYTNAQKSSRDSRRRQDLVTLQNAMEQYYTQKSFKYPECTDYTGCALALSEYISGEVPKDPMNSGSYVYTFNSTDTTYTISAVPEKCATYPDGQTICAAISVKNLQ